MSIEILQKMVPKRKLFNTKSFRLTKIFVNNADCGWHLLGLYNNSIIRNRRGRKKMGFYCRSNRISLAAIYRVIRKTAETIEIEMQNV